MANASTLESVIDRIVSAAAAEIAGAIRKAMAAAPGRPGASAAPSASRAAAPRPPGRPRGPRKAEAADDKVLAAIRANPGLRSEQLREKTGLSKAVITPALVRLRASGAVKTDGARRATTYHATGASAAASAPTAAGVSGAKGAARGKKGGRSRGAAKGKKKRAWPACSTAGCTNPMFGPSRERRLCYTHFVEAGGKHYSKTGA